jgi:hypothetical protein
MNRSISLLVNAAFAFSVVLPASSQADPVLARDGKGSSIMDTSMVKVERHARSVNDPLTQYGAGFFIAAFNKAGQPVAFGPDSIVVKDSRGRTLTLLTDERIAQIKEDEAKSSAIFGAVLGVGLGMLGGYAAARTPNPGAAMAVATTSVVVGQAIADNGQAQAAAIHEEADVLQLSYAANPLVPAEVDPMSAVSGRILVENLKDRDPASLFITVGSDVHEIDFK